MKKLLPSLLTLLFIISLTGLSGCTSWPAHDTPIVRFALRDDNIDSWEEKSNGVVVHLNSEGQRKLAGLTRTNPGKDMEIYAGRVLLTTSTIHQTLHGESLFVSVDDDIRDLAFSMLPAAKRLA